MRWATMRGMPRPPFDTWLVSVGLTLTLVGSAWLALSGHIGSGATPWAGLLLLWGSVGTLLAARRLGGPAWALPTLVLVSPLLVAAASRSGLGGAGPLGYENASAALYFVAAAAALVVAKRAPPGAPRALAACVGVAWVLLVWLSGSHAAGLLVVALLLSAFAVHTRRALGILLVGGGLLLAGALVGTIVLGATHQPGPRAGVLDRLIDSTLGDLRVMVWHDALVLARDRPLIGIGVGQYPIDSGLVEDRPAGAHVHSEYLEAAAETGLPGAALLVALLCWGGWNLWRGGCPSCAGTAGTALVGVGVHATVDYVLHFPHLVLAVAVLVGAGASTRHHACAHGERTVSPADRHLRRAGVYTVLLCLVLSVPGFLSPLPTVTNRVELSSRGDGVRFPEVGVLRSRENPDEVYRRLVAANALTVAMSVSPADARQGGPARIVSSSTGPSHRNLTVGQEADALVVRLRTTNTGLNASEDASVVDRVFRDGERRRIVVSYDGFRTRVYVDGRLRFDRAQPGGTFGNWNLAYPLLLGNEVGGQRPWLGTIHDVAIYDRALTDAQARPDQEDALVQYPFDAASDPWENRGVLGTGADLHSPARMAVELDAFWPTFSSLRSPATGAGWVVAAVRFLIHAALFVVFGFLVHRSGVVRTVAPWSAWLVASAAGGMAFAAELVRYAEGRAPSLATLLAAIGGAVAGIVLAGRSVGDPSVTDRPGSALQQHGKGP